MGRERDPRRLPAWLTQNVLDAYTEAFTASVFTGGLNWYRNTDRSWELTAPWHHAPVITPAYSSPETWTSKPSPVSTKPLRICPGWFPT